ncbi:hypothetical protein SAMN05216483_6212 [Streptomyces sp. 2131.1]|uniref:hypothetical protein n=1 Tax=Streptomyces sp. 2131.1 TaxID=1855346 RepID=UPI0008957B1B|nr:hypothetical protein [Streptomyces sp. 2131.1]SEE43622.1 hypothetical protein SAMN05216483_6212 [Streptomyces sp. 2131.1]
MNSATVGGLISSMHPEGDPVRTCEPATAPDLGPDETGQYEDSPEQPTIVRGQD